MGLSRGKKRAAALLAALAIGSTAGCPALLGLGDLTFRDNVPVDDGGAGGEHQDGGGHQDAATEPCKLDAAAPGPSCYEPVKLGSLKDVGLPTERELTLETGLPVDIDVGWFTVETHDLPEDGRNSYHVRVALEGNPDDEFRFVALRGTDCAQADAAPRLTEYDWCVDFTSQGAGSSPCGWVDGQHHCDRDESSDYRIGVARRPGATATCLPFRLRIQAGAGACDASSFGCGACEPAATLCAGNDLFTCAGGGLLQAECPPGECTRASCHPDGSCATVPLPVGAAGIEVNGDCRRHVCDGKGGVTLELDPADLPQDDGKICTDEVCVDGSPAHPQSAAGKPCGGGPVCTPAGVCGCTPGNAGCADAKTKTLCNASGQWVKTACNTACSNGVCS